ncbi:MAG TPA: CoA-binding protein [Bacteroidales bacterium]|nr:CoA-binding protein [Bacteroidales bacterium]
MKTTHQQLDDFFAASSLAIAGVSRDTKKFGNAVFRTLTDRGLKVYALNPNIDEVNGLPCYKKMSDLPEKAESMIILTKEDKALPILKEAVASGIRNIWFHNKVKDSAILKIIEDNNLNLIQGECILMFAPPVTGFHRFHRFLRGIAGSLPVPA